MLFLDGIVTVHNKLGGYGRKYWEERMCYEIIPMTIINLLVQ